MTTWCGLIRLLEPVTVYPDEDHLQRINHFVSPWLDAIKQEVASVDHPFLGNVENADPEY